MNWDEWSENDSPYESRRRRLLAARGPLAAREQIRVISATRPPDRSLRSDVQDYRMHMLLSALMLAVALLIATLQ